MSKTSSTIADTSALKIVGLKEIAVLLDVDPRTPHAWQYRAVLPAPDYEPVNGLRAWDRKTIVRWAAETGRLPSDGSLDAEVPKNAKVAEYRGGRIAKERTQRAAARRS